MEEKVTELYPPVTTRRGYYVLSQPAYKTPNVFNLNEKGLFKKSRNQKGIEGGV